MVLSMSIDEDDGTHAVSTLYQSRAHNLNVFICIDRVHGRL